MTWICWWSSYSWTYSLWEFDAFGKLWVRALWWDKTCAGLLSRWLALPWCLVHVGVYMRILNLLCPVGVCWINDGIMSIFSIFFEEIYQLSRTCSWLLVQLRALVGHVCLNGCQHLFAFSTLFYMTIFMDEKFLDIYLPMNFIKIILSFLYFFSNILSHKYCIITQLKSTTTGK